MTARDRRPQALDRDRFDKCRALMERGATEGERAAALAAATRVAATAGLTLAEALAARDSARPKWTESAPPHTPHPGRRPYPFQQRAKRPPKPEPITVEEIMRQKAEDLARRKKAAAREEKRMQKVHEEWEREHAAVREAQAERDREWAARREGGSQPGRSDQDEVASA